MRASGEWSHKALGGDAGLAPAVMNNKQRTSSTRLNSRLSRQFIGECGARKSEIILSRNSSDTSENIALLYEFKSCKNFFFYFF
jgi:hypothetical protein